MCAVLSSKLNHFYLKGQLTHFFLTAWRFNRFTTVNFLLVYQTTRGISPENQTWFAWLAPLKINLKNLLFKKTNVLLTVVARKHINSCELSLAMGIRLCKPGLVNYLCLKDAQAVQYRHILKPENRLFSLAKKGRKKSKTKPMTVTCQ